VTVGDGILLAVGVLIAGLLAWAWIEPTWLDVVCVSVHRAGETAGKPAGAGRLRILFLSDIHAEHLRVPPARILAACEAAQPDLVLFGGDLAGRPASLTVALDLLGLIRQLPALAGCPFLAVRGNHDGSPELARLLSERGIRLLVNDAALVNARGQDWLVVGLDDLITGHADPGALASMIRAAPDIAPSRRLVLAHNPDTLLDLQPDQAALFLAGHLHGGQIWLPFQLEFHVLRGEKLPRKGYVRGLFSWQGLPAYISRGLGCVLLPLRLFSRPELTIIDLD
jgi:uncharacterized protein